MTKFLQVWTLVASLMIVLGLAPLASALLAGWIADSYGCNTNLLGAPSCIINGIDRGEALRFMNPMTPENALSQVVGLLSAALGLMLLILAIIIRVLR